MSTAGSTPWGHVSWSCGTSRCDGARRAVTWALTCPMCGRWTYWCAACAARARLSCLAWNTRMDDGGSWLGLVAAMAVDQDQYLAPEIAALALGRGATDVDRGLCRGPFAHEADRVLAQDTGDRSGGRPGDAVLGDHLHGAGDAAHLFRPAGCRHDGGRHVVDRRRRWRRLGRGGAGAHQQDGGSAELQPRAHASLQTSTADFRGISRRSPAASGLACASRCPSSRGRRSSPSGQPRRSPR